MARLIHLPGVVGLDEAGRGPLAGPVVCAAVALPAEFDVEGLNDSKKLSPEQRQRCARRIREGAIFAVEFVSNEAIDATNILKASLEGMRRAFTSLPIRPEKALVDGNKIPPGLGVSTEAIVKGDGKYACIAAASILAKTARDAYMISAADRYPDYGFERHFGYPTPEHLAILARIGPCPLHRMTFAPLKSDPQGGLFGP